MQIGLSCLACSFCPSVHVADMAAEAPPSQRIMQSKFSLSATSCSVLGLKQISMVSEGKRVSTGTRLVAAATERASEVDAGELGSEHTPPSPGCRGAAGRAAWRPGCTGHWVCGAGAAGLGIPRARVHSPPPLHCPCCASLGYRGWPWAGRGLCTQRLRVLPAHAYYRVSRQPCWALTGGSRAGETLLTGFTTGACVGLLGTPDLLIHSRCRWSLTGGRGIFGSWS